MWPYLQPTRQSNEMQNVFLGLDKNLRSDTRGWYDMENISPRDFPVFAPRRPRGTVKTLTAPAGIAARDALVYVDGAALYINGTVVTGLTLSTAVGFVPKQLVSMGAYICIFPDKKYVNTADLTDYGSMESTFTFEGSATFSPARVDGIPLPSSIPIGTSAPIDPNNADYWIDTSTDNHVLRQYSAMSETWTEIPSVYTKIDLTGVGQHFRKYDGVTISGVTFSGTDTAVTGQMNALNGAHILYDVQTDYIIVTGLLNSVVMESEASITISRTVPAMDFVVESNNRLWGCKYGLVNGETVNEIYACKQGDFTNWSCFMGTATDSYAASVGTDGKFTGAIAHLGYPLFFKENCLHKVYGDYPANYQIETINCRGVQEGSHRSVQTVNEVVYYKGRTEVLMYDGSLPVGISDALGGDTYSDARAGVYKDSYYISMMDGGNAYHLFLYDTKKRVWFREDTVKAMGFAQIDDELYWIDEATKNLVAAFGTSGTKEAAVAWNATTGIIGYETPNHKYISRFNIRVKMDSSATFRVYLRYDSEGEWENVGDMRGTGIVRTFLLPVRPRRCDHLEMKLEGTGEVRVFSIARVLEIGGDGR